MDWWLRGRIIYAYLLWIVFKLAAAGGFFGKYTRYLATCCASTVLGISGLYSVLGAKGIFHVLILHCPDALSSTGDRVLFEVLCSPHSARCTVNTVFSHPAVLAAERSFRANLPEFLITLYELPSPRVACFLREKPISI